MSTPSTLLAVITLLALSPAALASVPADTSFQGRLLDASGAPLAGPVDLAVGIWTALVGGEGVYRETHTGVPLDDGVFHVRLGTGATEPGETPFPEVFAVHADLYLEVSVEGETLAPRQPIGSAPYAFKAETSAAFEALSAELCRLFIKLGEELPPGCPALKRVFVTSTRYTGDLGGIPGADEKCQSHADAAGLAGTFLAWISDGVDSPVTTFARSAEPYVRTDGTKIAEDWDDLVDDALLAPINVLEDGTPATGPDTVWTGTSSNGKPAASNCTGWTVDGGGGSGTVGRRGSTSFGWTVAGGQLCTGVVTIDGNPLYCFEQ